MSTEPVTVNAASALTPPPTPEPGETLAAPSADRGDGTYANPVLFADYSDPDAIRVGDDYWLTASSFNHVPGLPILHSRDLVTWTLVNHALPRLRPQAHFATPRHGGGVWAPSLRFHAGRYWIFHPDPDFGLFVTTAADPRDVWSEPVCVKAGKGLIDPCPFWDDDGAGYLIHGWAKSRSGVKNRLTLHRLRADNLAVDDAGEVVIDGDKMPGWHTIEGPKLYRRAGYYYIFAPAGGVRDGYQAVFRSRELRGPFESRIVLAQGSTPVNGPHQGAWVDTPTGEHWFLHFQERSALGRVVHLQPLTWRDDWPEIGQPARDGPGEPVAQWTKPASARSQKIANPRRSTADPATPGLEWQWQANPQPGWFCASNPLAAGQRANAHGGTSSAVAPPQDASPVAQSSSATTNGWVLACVPLPAKGNLWHAGNLLLRKFTGPAFAATGTLELVSGRDGDRTGLLVFGYDYAWLGLRREQGETRLGLYVCHAANHEGTEICVAAVDWRTGLVEVRVEVDDSAHCQFAYRDMTGTFQPIGRPFAAKSSAWVGAKVGVFAGGNGVLPHAQGPAVPTSTPGHARVSGFTLKTAARP